MAGLIKAEDVALVKERSLLEEVIREHVTLKPAGPRSLKGLCPFHDEKTPSFTVSPDNGTYHCFGCDKGGDVISFVMEVEHLTFSETVERLAGRAGIELHYEDGAGPREEGAGRRSRLVEAHRVASEFYAEALISASDARVARDFLRARQFDRSVAEHFGLGFAPRGGEVLAQHLRDKGFRDDEVVLAGLVGRGRGLYDRFRGRLVWPIHDITGDPIGFGARRIFDDDRIEAKYLNTAETPIYKKTQVLYGLDLAKKAIARDRKAVIVEGYTDVMAAHLAGVEQAVATCGTSFGSDHVRTLRRLLRDAPDQQPAKVVYTFDGDAAGQKAAMRAFELDGQWDARSFVAVAAEGQDPCELRLSGGDAAVRALVDDATPMFEFAVRTTLRRFDLDSPEGRVLGARAIAPILAAVRDQAMRAEYMRTAAGWVGVSEEHLRAEIARAGNSAGRPGAGQDKRRAPAAEDPQDDAPPTDPGMPAPNERDPIVRAESQLLECLLQFPASVPARELAAVRGSDFTAPAHRSLFAAVMAAGPPGERTPAVWLDDVRLHAPEVVHQLLFRYAVATLPTRLDPSTGAPQQRYARSLLVRVREVALQGDINTAMSELRRADPASSREVAQRLTQLQKDLTLLRASLD
ncbi:DNA primase [Allobranchiibius sp. CTAmp26]|uniref:DNA primase n=1 Tax=Allobranchiibius sp. CTAmp26 TaxID=2815214 RepID=UPI001AA171B0|nr:DNA primase [Allobranchiibius sp. CTAmp26]MBO1754753.1 DNA primase [Allobranchiibius sp. CTAmp26]